MSLERPDGKQERILTAIDEELFEDFRDLANKLGGRRPGIYDIDEGQELEVQGEEFVNREKEKISRQPSGKVSDQLFHFILMQGASKGGDMVRRVGFNFHEGSKVSKHAFEGNAQEGFRKKFEEVSDQDLQYLLELLKRYI